MYELEDSNNIKRNLVKDFAKLNRKFYSVLLAHLSDESQYSRYKDSLTGKNSIYEYYKSVFQKSFTTLEEFTDDYVKAISNGLLFIVLNYGEVKLSQLGNYLPKNIEIIKAVFETIQHRNIPSDIKTVIDEIICYVNTLICLSTEHQNAESAFIYYDFYEKFLNMYNSEQQHKKGVYYTPIPIIRFMVKSLSQILETHFNLSIADEYVNILDFASGTGAFLVEIINILILKNENLTISNETFQNIMFDTIYGFEIELAPYTIAHIQLSALMKHIGKMSEPEQCRIGLYLTDTLNLDHTQTDVTNNMFLKENQYADEIKNDNAFYVIIGNPPYLGSSSATHKKIKSLISEYKMVNGRIIKEKNSKWLQDDYVKFIRFAQWKIEKNGEGIACLITNHNYLDNTTFNGMRYSLLKKFDWIYVLNLHGNRIKNDPSTSGIYDENVFDISSVGTSIVFLIKNKKLSEKKVYYHELYGSKADKLEWLGTHSLNTSPMKEIKPESPNYLLTNRKRVKTYDSKKYIGIKDIFTKIGVGTLTHRDSVAISSSVTNLRYNLSLYYDPSITDDEIKKKFKIKSKSTESISKHRKKLFGKDLNLSDIILYHYRAFDYRYIYFNSNIIDRPRDINKHLLRVRGNLALVCQRQTYGKTFRHAFITDRPTDLNIISNLGGGVICPLYLFRKEGRVSNIRQGFIQSVVSALGVTPLPEEILAYIYSILYSNHYRDAYGVRLMRDFPRIPITDDVTIFKRLASLGLRLIKIHLLQTNFDQMNIIYNTSQNASDKVIQIQYDNARLNINEKNYFENIPKEVFDYTIGTYKVFKKYLASRVGKVLTTSDINHLIRLGCAITDTINIVKQIDQVITKTGLIKN